MNRLNEKEEVKTINHECLRIESITLLDGVTPDERVQYKVGREVAKLVGAGIGSRFFVFYDENRGWKTNPVNNIDENEEKIVLRDNLSIYNFKKQMK